MNKFLSILFLIPILLATFIFFLCIDLPMTLLGLFMVPLGLLFCKKDSEHMPKLFWFWDNDRDGINGDGREPTATDPGAGWKGNEHTQGNQQSMWNRFRWLAIRNPANNFGYLIGFKQTADVTYHSIGNPQTSDQGQSGTLFVVALKNNIIVSYAFYLVFQYPFAKSKCLRFFSGWKIQDNIDSVSFQNNLNTNAQFVFVPNPLMTFKS